jgi:hypothetical protein
MRQEDEELEAWATRVRACLKKTKHKTKQRNNRKKNEILIQAKTHTLKTLWIVCY